MKRKTEMCSAFHTIIVWGGLWGIFEATVGYLLHLLPLSIGWLVWYPIACFFMFNVYRKTRRALDILLVGCLSACIKLFNLFLPVTIDKVLNPAVSIVFEALAMAMVILLIDQFYAFRERTLLVKAISVLCMNTGWRLLYALYLLLLVPEWMREISVIRSADAMILFFLTHNFFTSLVLFGGSIMINHILKPFNAIEDILSTFLSTFHYRWVKRIKIAATLCLIGSSILLELLL